MPNDAWTESWEAVPHAFAIRVASAGRMLPGADQRLADLTEGTPPPATSPPEYVIFGALHLMNPDASLWGAFAIAVQAGITLAVLYILPRSLWLAIGTHLAWNFWQIFLGLTRLRHPGNDGYWTAKLTGDTWLTGGTFGYEGSVVTTLIWLAVAAVLLPVAIRRGRIRPLRPPEHAQEGQEPQHGH
jgi:hypothetical protein